MCKELQLSDDERLRSYTVSLLKQGLILSKGIRKGTYYIVNPKLIRNANANNIPTTLKTVEPSVLKSLVIHDIETHPWCKISEITDRLPDVELKEVRKIVYSLVGKGRLSIDGAKSNRRYSLK